jgi:ABC-type Fe3+/spermidine/putrescine transport system ATPase subunit
MFRATTSQPVIIARNLVKKYANNLVVNGIDLTIYKGECFGLLGPNGAGKTSTLKMISCISPITSGELIIKGKSVSDDQLGVKSELGVVPQENNLDSDLTVLDNLLTYARYYDMNSSTALSRAWGATRSVLTATTILAFTYILGMVSSPWALLIIPVSFIIGLMFASIAITVTALVPSLNSLNNFFSSPRCGSSVGYSFH